MLIAEKRPRSLRWFHAGPLLFGDWGTSRLYVLGLAFYYTGHASPLYLGAMSLIMFAVAWAYTVVCRCFPDGGGVYTAARQLSPTLSIIGATLLLCDYIVTAALSGVEAFHYFGVPRDLTVVLCVFTFGFVGVINWLGARSAGRFALIIALGAIAASALIAVLCVRYLPAGLSTVSTGHASVVDPWTRWESLVRIVLALSGVEAVANMTGLMSQPVKRTARRTIWPVLVEVVALNMLFGIALNAMPALKPVDKPHYVQHEIEGKLSSDAVPEAVKEYRDTAMRVLATQAGTDTFGPAIGRALGLAAGIVFGLLLLSAVNTAVMAMVAVMYAMARDGEVPGRLARLNYSGVPWIPLIIACIAPGLVLLFEADVKALGELYAIGVVGAITINLLSCAANNALEIRRWERRALWALGGLMAVIELTIIFAKFNATIFAGVVIAVVLGTRTISRHAARRAADARAAAHVPVPAAGWLAEIQREPKALDARRPRMMLAARGRDQAAFAIDLAARRNAILFAIYVRTLRVLDTAPGQLPRIEDDLDAQVSLGTAAVLARQAGVTFVPIYITSSDIAAEILDYTVTYGCDTLIMGKTRRSLFARRLEGDVVAQVAAHLPEEVSLITRAATAADRASAAGPATGTDARTPAQTQEAGDDEESAGHA